MYAQMRQPKKSYADLVQRKSVFNTYSENKNERV